jgi:hypothetical protein
MNKSSAVGASAIFAVLMSVAVVQAAGPGRGAVHRRLAPHVPFRPIGSVGRLTPILARGTGGESGSDCIFYVDVIGQIYDRCP